jgi:hypothetical protein
MTKKQFIWFVIRFVGMIYIFLAVPAVLTLGNCLYNLIKTYPYTQAGTYFASYFLIYQALASASVVLIAVYLLFCGKFLCRIVDKSTVWDDDCGLNNYKYAEILIRFVGVYFLWRILCHLCIALYSAGMLTRLKSAPADFQQLAAKNDMLAQHFKNLHINLSPDSLIGLLLTAGLAYYFLKHGKLIIDLFCRRWLPEEPQAPVSPTPQEPEQPTL